MSDVRPAIQSLERLREQAIAALVPFFLDGAGSDVQAARVVIAGLLDDYRSGTPKELQLSTQIVALSWAAIACLRTGVAAKNLSMEEVLDLQDSAIALDRSCRKATKALETRQQERAKNPSAMTAENTRWDEGAFQLVINQALDKMTDANVKLAAYMATVAPVEAKPRLSIQSAEQMTPAVLARRASHQSSA
jgi:hypothetical protein